MMCPAETPEGQAVGLVKNLALMAYITGMHTLSGLYQYPALIQLVCPPGGGHSHTNEGLLTGYCSQFPRLHCSKIIHHGCTPWSPRLLTEKRSQKHGGLMYVWWGVGGRARGYREEVRSEFDF